MFTISLLRIVTSPTGTASFTASFQSISKKPQVQLFNFVGIEASHIHLVIRQS